MVRPKDRVNVLVIALSVFSLLLLLGYVYKQRTLTECQSRVNAVYLDTLKERGELSDQYFDSFDRLIIGVFAARSKEDSLRAYEVYQNDRDDYLRNRAKYQYPDYSKVCQK